jgi:hypothetical protein
MFRLLSDAAAFEEHNLDRPVNEIINDIKGNPAYAESTLDFLQTTFINRLYPFACKAVVYPGVIYHSESFMMYESPSQWTWYIGTDFYIQSREKFGRIKICKDYGIGLNDLDLKHAILGVTYQSKLLLAASYLVKREHVDCLLALNAAQTFTNTGIGKSFSVAFTVETNF